MWKLLKLIQSSFRANNLLSTSDDRVDILFLFKLREISDGISGNAIIWLGRTNCNLTYSRWFRPLNFVAFKISIGLKPALNCCKAPITDRSGMELSLLRTKVKNVKLVRPLKASDSIVWIWLVCRRSDTSWDKLAKTLFRSIVKILLDKSRSDILLSMLSGMPVRFRWLRLMPWASSIIMMTKKYLMIYSEKENISGRCCHEFRHTLKRICRHFDEISIIGCTEIVVLINCVTSDKYFIKM